MTGDQREHPSDIEMRRPGGEGDGAAGLQHAQHLADGDLGTRREHVAELAEHHVELVCRLSASPSAKSTSRFASCACSRARSIRTGDRSRPLTFAPRRAAVIAATPVPHPTSSSLWPVATPAKLTSLAAEGVVNTSIGVNSDQASFWTALKPANGSCAVMELSLRSMSAFMRLTTDAKGSTRAHDA